MKTIWKQFACIQLASVTSLLAFGDSRLEEGIEDKGSWSGFVGVGIMREPLSPGLSKKETDPLPYLDITYKDRFFIGRYGVGGYVINKPDIGQDEGFSMGLSIGFEDGRKVSDYPEYLAGMGDIESGMEGNLFFEGEIGIAEYSLVVSKGLESKGHDGLHSEFSVMFGGPVMDNLLVEFGPFVHYGDSTYSQSYYGVTESQAEVSRFSEYTMKPGVDQVGLKAISRTRLTDRWVLLGMVEYASLVGDAKDSPIVEDDKSRSFGVGIAYGF